VGGRERTVTLRNQLGLHARAASRFVELAGQFRSRIRISSEGSVVDGKSILGILTLAAPVGSTIVILAEGADAEQAVDRLAALVEDRFGEER
jgi:phosphocarrier protein